MEGFNPHKETFSNRGFYKLVAYAAILGIIVGLAASAFLLVEQSISNFIWKAIPNAIGEVTFYALFVCLTGGGLLAFANSSLATILSPCVKHWRMFEQRVALMWHTFQTVW
jgi:Na+/serine symporter